MQQVALCLTDDQARQLLRSLTAALNRTQGLGSVDIGYDDGKILLWVGMEDTNVYSIISFQEVLAWHEANKE
jgi:hypothetical protein